MYKYNPDWCGTGILDVENATSLYHLKQIPLFEFYRMLIITIITGASGVLWKEVSIILAVTKSLWIYRPRHHPNLETAILTSPFTSSWPPIPSTVYFTSFLKPSASLYEWSHCERWCRGSGICWIYLYKYDRRAKGFLYSSHRHPGISPWAFSICIFKLFAVLYNCPHSSLMMHCWCLLVAWPVTFD